jgi:hypothetical protein
MLLRFCSHVPGGTDASFKVSPRQPHERPRLELLLHLGKLALGRSHAANRERIIDRGQLR